MPPSTSTAAPVSTPSQPVSDLSLSPEELKICEKWITPYSALETAEDRLKMLRGAILPRLTLVNTGMAEESWKARKSQIKRWFQSHSRGHSIRSRLSFVKKISLKQVACHEYKADIAEIATRLSGAEAGEQPYISVFQAAINELMESLDEDQIARLEETRANWLSRGQPREQQRKAAEKMGRHYLQEASRVQFNNFGMRAVVFEFHENRAGTKLFQMHDFNDSLGKVKVEAFRDKFPDAVADFQMAWIEYMRYCYRIEAGEEVDKVVVNRPIQSLIDLDRDDKGYPMLPPSRADDTLQHMKKLIRSFITAHYRFASGRLQDRVPWKHIKDHAADFIRPGHLPEAVLMNAGDQAAQLEDPSDMRKEQIVRLLEHWRRPVSASDLFRFTHVLVNGKGGEVEPALYTNSLGPQSFPHNAPLPATSGSETRDETGSGGEILPTAYENVHEPQSFSQDTSWLATDGAVTRDEHCRNANTLTEHDPGLPAGPEVDASLGQEERHSPQQDLGPAGALDVTTPTTSLEAGPSPLTFDNRPLGAGRPRPKPKPKGRQNNVQPEPPATDLNPDGVGGEVEGVLGRPRRQPKTRKLDACLTMQFEAVEKEQERERAKLNKVREEKRAKRDAQVGRPAKRQRTSLK